MSVTAMKAGAIDFLTTRSSDQDLPDTIQRGIRLDRERRPEAEQLPLLRARCAALTPRKREVTAIVAEGRTRKQIAAAPDLEEVTVKVHRAPVIRKLETKSLPELARTADRLKTMPSANSG